MAFDDVRIQRGLQNRMFTINEKVAPIAKAGQRSSNVGSGLVRKVGIDASPAHIIMLISEPMM